MKDRKKKNSMKNQTKAPTIKDLVNDPLEDQKMKESSSMSGFKTTRKQNIKNTNNQMMNKKMGNNRQLTNMNDQQIKGDLKNANAVQKNNKEIDDKYRKQLAKKITLADRVLNRSLVKEVQKHRKDLFNASAETRVQLYKTVLDGRLQALQEKTNAGLLMVRSHYRSQVTEFVTLKMYELATNINERQEMFLGLLMEKYDKIEQLQGYPKLQQLYKESVINESRKYMEFLDGLIMNFANIIENEVDQFQ